MTNAIDFLKEKLQELNFTSSIVSDTGWDKGSYGGRCITDYSREIKFSTVLSPEDLATVKKIMAEKFCPGWTGVAGYLANADEVLYKFSTTWDSSD